MAIAVTALLKPDCLLHTQIEDILRDCLLEWSQAIWCKQTLFLPDKVIHLSVPKLPLELLD